MEDHRTEDVEQNGEDVEQGRDVDQVAPALIAVHPNQDSVAVSVGLELRVFDLRKDYSVSLVDESGLASHKDPIRAIRYGAKGNLFVSAGDDKLVKIWDTVSWHCLSTLCSDKRVSAVAISSDELHVCCADKFGVVWVVALSKSGGQKVVGDAKSVPVLAHYCSITTSLEFSPDGWFIVSADRDFKIHVTVFPENPLIGAHEIQKFLSWTYRVRLWDVTSGDLLDTCKVVAKAEDVKSNGSEDECSSVTDICTIPDCSFVAVAIQSLRGIMLLRCDLSSKCLSIVKEKDIPESLRTELDTYWPYLSSKQEENFGFWQHEWEKHGRCTSKSHILHVLNYLLTTVNLMKKTSNLRQALVDKKIMPGGQYPKKDIKDAIGEKIGKDGVVLKCRFKDNAWILTELLLCADKKVPANFISCTPQDMAQECTAQMINFTSSLIP